MKYYIVTEKVVCYRKIEISANSSEEAAKLWEAGEGLVLDEADDFSYGTAEIVSVTECED